MAAPTRTRSRHPTPKLKRSCQWGWAGWRPGGPGGKRPVLHEVPPPPGLRCPGPSQSAWAVPVQPVGAPARRRSGQCAGALAERNATPRSDQAFGRPAGSQPPKLAVPGRLGRPNLKLSWVGPGGPACQRTGIIGSPNFKLPPSTSVPGPERSLSGSPARAWSRCSSGHPESRAGPDHQPGPRPLFRCSLILTTAAARKDRRLVTYVRDAPDSAADSAGHPCSWNHAP